MSEVDPGLPDIDHNVAVNLRAFRERAGLSQEDLAQRASEHGFGCTQATIWKIEQGQRSVRVKEAVALASALDLPRWIELTDAPTTNKCYADLQSAARRAYETYGRLKEAATAYNEAQLGVAMAVRAATDAGLGGLEDVGLTAVWGDWLTVPGERAVVEARVELVDQSELAEERQIRVDAIMQALREHGHALPRPEDIEIIGGEPADP